MAGFLYYIPGETGASMLGGDTLHADRLERYGLAEVLADARRVPDQVTLIDQHRAGPDGGAGVILYPVPADPAPARAPRKLGHDRSTQAWTEAGPYWLGNDRERLPTAADLLRRSALPLLPAGPCLDVPDRLGNRWRVPVARSPGDAMGHLPRAYTFGAGGQVVQALRADQRRLWELAGEIFDDVYGTGSVERTRQVEILSEVLGITYRLGRPEIARLIELGRLEIDDQFLGLAFSVLVDFGLPDRLTCKKKEPAAADPPPEETTP